MLAYVKLVQSREKELGCDVLTHQKWSGAGYIDGILGHIQSGSSGSKSMGEGNTETGMLNSSRQIVSQANHPQASKYRLGNSYHPQYSINHINNIFALTITSTQQAGALHDTRQNEPETT